MVGSKAMRGHPGKHFVDVLLQLVGIVNGVDWFEQECVVNIENEMGIVRKT